MKLPISLSFFNPYYDINKNESKFEEYLFSILDLFFFLTMDRSNEMYGFH